MNRAGNDSIAIIGGGFSGIVTAWRLAREPDFAAPITLIEGERPLGPAYATRCDTHRLNTPAGRMSALPEWPDHFVDYAMRETGRSRAALRRAYLPRRLYGRYLESLRSDAIANGVRCYSTHALCVEATTGARFRIACADRRSIDVRRVVLAVGPGGPSAPRVLSGIAQSTNFFADPWTTAACRPSSADEPIALIGTGQTAVDIALELVEQGHRGPIMALSRHGLIPGVHGRPSSTRRAPDIDGMPTDSAPALQRWWRDQIVRQGSSQAAHAALRPMTTACWQRLAPGVRARLLRHARAYWDIERHRLAPEVAERLNAVRDSGQLEIQAGRLVRAESTDNGITLAWRPRGPCERIETRRFVRVINCTGFGGFAGAKASPLLGPMLDDGLLCADSHGLGVTPVATGLYLVGALQRGRYWESTAVPELACHCRAMLREIIGHGSSIGDIETPRPIDADRPLLAVS